MDIEIKPRSLEKSQKLLERSRKVIPGASQTFSKSTSQYVQGVAPVFLERGEGCRVWDVDGNVYIDYVQGLLPNILGYAEPRVNEAALRQLNKGHSFSLPSEVEVELAEALCELIPCAEMVRFGKNGSDVTSAAIRVSRAFTGREHVVSCGYHGWHDWTIGASPRHLGVPEAVRNLTHTFQYNDLSSLEKLFQAYPEQIAAVIMEPMNFVFPEAGFLEGVAELARQHGALLVFDEICSGFHFGLGGAQKYFGVTPDLACFGKALGNGFPISAIVGRRDVMQLFEEVFFSGTFGGEAMSMAACLEVLKILKQDQVIDSLWQQGETLKRGIQDLIKANKLEKYLQIDGISAWTLINYLQSDQDVFLIKSFVQQEFLKRGILILATHNLCFFHDQAVIDYTLKVYAEVLPLLAQGLAAGDLQSRIEGQMIQPVFKVR